MYLRDVHSRSWAIFKNYQFRSNYIEKCYGIIVTLIEDYQSITIAKIHFKNGLKDLLENNMDADPLIQLFI